MRNLTTGEVSVFEQTQTSPTAPRRISVHERAAGPSSEVEYGRVQAERRRVTDEQFFEAEVTRINDQRRRREAIGGHPMADFRNEIQLSVNERIDVQDHVPEGTDLDVDYAPDTNQETDFPKRKSPKVNVSVGNLTALLSEKAGNVSRDAQASASTEDDGKKEKKKKKKDKLSKAKKAGKTVKGKKKNSHVFPIHTRRLPKTKAKVVVQKSQAPNPARSPAGSPS